MIAHVTAKVKLVGTSIVCLDPDSGIVVDPCPVVAQELEEVDDTVEAVDVERFALDRR